MPFFPRSVGLAATASWARGAFPRAASTPYSARGQYAQAEPLVKRSLVIAEKALGPAHPNVVTSLWNMAEPYKKAGGEKEAHRRAPIYWMMTPMTLMAIAASVGCAGVPRPVGTGVLGVEGPGRAPGRARSCQLLRGSGEPADGERGD